MAPGRGALPSPALARRAATPRQEDSVSGKGPSEPGDRRGRRPGTAGRAPRTGPGRRGGPRGLCTRRGHRRGTDVRLSGRTFIYFQKWPFMKKTKVPRVYFFLLLRIDRILLKRSTGEPRRCHPKPSPSTRHRAVGAAGPGSPTAGQEGAGRGEGSGEAGPVSRAGASGRPRRPTWWEGFGSRAGTVCPGPGTLVPQRAARGAARRLRFRCRRSRVAAAASRDCCENQVK